MALASVAEPIVDDVPGVRLGARFPLLLCFRPRGLCSSARPSEEGGLEELVEFLFRPASCRSRSAIRFSAFGYFTAQFLVLAQQQHIFPMQLFTAGLVGVPMAIGPCLLLPRAADCSRTRPPYVKRFGEICSAPTCGVGREVRYNHTKLHSGRFRLT
jgi:hypothetical protein